MIVLFAREQAGCFEGLRQLFFGRQAEHVLRGEYSPPIGERGVLGHRFTTIGAEDDPDRGVIVGSGALIVEQANVEVHLADVLRRELPCFQIDQYEAFEDVMVKHKIDVVMVAVGTDALLTSDKRESRSQFHLRIA